MQNNTLTRLFPVIRTREIVMTDIRNNKALSATFDNWQDYQQELFLDICTGAKGVKMLFDPYFKEIFNPETDSNRLSKLLSVILGIMVTVKDVLPNDSTRLGDESSLIITDIVVELEDGSIANVEVQKIGYAFTGERASCYSADLLLRQYKRVRDKRKEKFSYKDIAPVYTIVFMEKSPAIFYDYPNICMHKFSTTSDTGLKLNMLQNFIFVPIDIFLGKLHNEGINSEFDAWLTFLGCDEPKYIVDLIQKYPYFKDLYSHLYETCRNTERMMNMFSKELQILDRNTVKYMIDELQEELDTTKEELDTTKEELDTANATIAEKDVALAEKDALIAELKAQLKSQNNNK